MDSVRRPTALKEIVKEFATLLWSAKIGNLYWIRRRTSAWRATAGVFEGDVGGVVGGGEADLGAGGGGERVGFFSGGEG